MCLGTGSILDKPVLEENTERNYENTKNKIAKIQKIKEEYIKTELTKYRQ